MTVELEIEQARAKGDHLWADVLVARQNSDRAWAKYQQVLKEKEPIIAAIRQRRKELARQRELCYIVAAVFFALTFLSPMIAALLSAIIDAFN